MINWLARLRPLVTALALPVGGIALSYTFFVDPPLRKQIATAQAKATKLADTVKSRSAEHAASARALEQTIRAQRELTQLVSTTPKSDAATESPSASPSVDNSSIVNHSVNVDSPLSTLSATLALFSRHHLECLASEPANEPSEEPKDRRTDRRTDPQSDRPLERRTVRVTLHGSFADMHGALEEMQSAPSCVSIVSLEMEASSAGQTTHRWILILLV